MKAIVYSEYGPPDVLHLKEVEKPVPADNEVLIRVHAAEATKSDCEMRVSKFAVKWFWLPMRLAMGVTKPRKQILVGYFGVTGWMITNWPCTGEGSLVRLRSDTAACKHRALH